MGDTVVDDALSRSSGGRRLDSARFTYSPKETFVNRMSFVSWRDDAAPLAQDEVFL
ncbi:MAG TPA: hypothetical protein VMF88_00580 [Bacteroidota bacterium]|nr:hypothetical protein [Bacteroidota bacterium]